MELGHRGACDHQLRIMRKRSRPRSFVRCCFQRSRPYGSREQESIQQQESNVLINQQSALAQQAKSQFTLDAQQAAIEWKRTTDSIPDIARVDAPYIRDGKPQGSYAVCLPPEQATFNLLPDIRTSVLELFSAEHIHWHAAIDAGPTNHLLSSQVQCVNALAPGILDAEFVHAAFASVLPIEEVLEVEPGRFLTFEYIGAHDYLHERVGMTRNRGTMTTSADAAIKYRSNEGDIELALIEWKYTEDYRGVSLTRPRGVSREDRYRFLWDDPNNPLRRDVIPYEDMFVEPFYQLMRQQLLAWSIERDVTSQFDVARVVHICPKQNVGVHGALNRDAHRAAGDDVLAIWAEVCAKFDRFISLDNDHFLQPGLRTEDYATRYLVR